MQTYIGTKLITASPMSRQEYNDYRGWTLPADEDGSDEGYLVEYLDGGKPNHPNHKGYISWSPKAVFEQAYHLVPGFLSDMELQPHQQRVVAEKAELDVKYSKLFRFIHGEQFFVLCSEAERERMTRQLNAMLEYSEILGERIEAFTN